MVTIKGSSEIHGYTELRQLNRLCSAVLSSKVGLRNGDVSSRGALRDALCTLDTLRSIKVRRALLICELRWGFRDTVFGYEPLSEPPALVSSIPIP